MSANDEALRFLESRIGVRNACLQQVVSEVVHALGSRAASMVHKLLSQTAEGYTGYIDAIVAVIRTNPMNHVQEVERVVAATPACWWAVGCILTDVASVSGEMRQVIQNWREETSEGQLAAALFARLDGEDEDQVYHEQLRRNATNPYVNVRLAVLDAVDRLMYTDLLPLDLVVEALDDANPEVAERAAYIYQHVDPRRLIQRDVQLDHIAIETLGGNALRESFLICLLRIRKSHPDSEVRAAAARELYVLAPDVFRLRRH
jgi:hypothetical protein